MRLVRGGKDPFNWTIRDLSAFLGRSRILLYRLRWKRHSLRWAPSARGNVQKSKTRKYGGRRRRVAGRDQILSAAREIGVRQGWIAVTFLSVAHKLGYTSPLL